MSDTAETTVTNEFGLFYETRDTELIEIRKFIDPEIDLSSLEGIDALFDRLNHLIK